MQRSFFSWALVCATFAASITSAWAAPEWVRGEITKMAPERAQVTLKHEAIKSIGMDAMTMPYKVKNASVLKGYKVGDVVRFTVKVQGDQMLIDALERAK